MEIYIEKKVLTFDGKGTLMLTKNSPAFDFDVKGRKVNVRNFRVYTPGKLKDNIKLLWKVAKYIFGRKA